MHGLCKAALWVIWDCLQDPAIKVSTAAVFNTMVAQAAMPGQGSSTARTQVHAKQSDVASDRAELHVTLVHAGLLWVTRSLGTGAHSAHSRAEPGDYDPEQRKDPSVREADQWEQSMLYYQGLGYAPARAL